MKIIKEGSRAFIMFDKIEYSVSYPISPKEIEMLEKDGVPKTKIKEIKKELEVKNDS